MGGLLKFVTVDPSTDGVTGHLQAGTSSVHRGDELGYSLRGAVNVPLSDTWAVRASGFTRRDPGYIDNVQTGEEDLNRADAHGARFSALWRPSADFSLKLSALVQQIEGDGSSDVFSNLGELQQSLLRGAGAYDRKAQAYSATLAAKLGRFDLTAISGYNRNEIADSVDFSDTAIFRSTAQNLFGVGGVPLTTDIDAEKFTQEIRLSAPIGTKVDWLFGVFYTDEDSGFEQNALAVDPATGARAGNLLNLRIPTQYTEYAAFTDLTFHVTDRLDIQIGGRESRIEQVFSQTQVGPLANASANVSGLEVKPSAFTYLLTPQFRFSPHLMMYARLASGYRAGGINSSAGVPLQYDPDETRNYEIGAKGDFLDRTLSVDASLYSIDWKDIQVRVRHPVTQLAFTANSGEARSKGVELTVESRPRAGLRIASWVSWNDAVLTADIPPGPVYGLEGDRLPLSSRFSGNLSLDEEFPLGARMSGFVGGSVSYLSRRLGNFRSVALRQEYPAYAIADATAGVRHDSWTLTLFINNLTDRRGVLSGGLDGSPITAFSYVQPRTIGLSAVKTFALEGK
jgi:outer membrane receptor protein involved in Fe transport